MKSILIIAALLTLWSFPGRAQQIYPDTTFGSSGIKSYPGWATNKSIHHFTQRQRDGKYLVVRSWETAYANAGTYLERYNADGNPDLQFGNNGKVSIGSFTNNGSVIIDTTGVSDQIIVKNYSEIQKLNLDGSEDLTFGINGKLKLDLIPNSNFNYGTFAAIDRDGNIYLSLSTFSSSYIGILTVKFDRDGNLVQSFGGSGTGRITTFSANKNVSPQAIIYDSKRNRIIVSGSVSYTSGSSTVYDVLFAAYQLNGSPDLTFGSSGKIIHSTISADREFISGAYYSESDSSVYISGYIGPGSSYPVSVSTYFISQIYHDGSMNPGFGNGGKILNNFPVPYNASFSGIKLTQNAIYAYGSETSSNDVYRSSFVRKYDRSGQLEIDFGQNGKLTIHELNRTNEEIKFIDSDESGNLNFVMNSFDGFDFNIGFGEISITGQVQLNNVQPINNLHPDIDVYFDRNIRLDSQGNLVTVIASFNTPAVIKMDVNGQPIETFGDHFTKNRINDSPGVTRIIASGDYHTVYDLAITPADEIYILLHNNGSASPYFLIKLSADGAIDPTFGVNGFKQLENVAGYTSTYFYTLNLSPEGKLITSGILKLGSNFTSFIQKYELDGNPDVSFGGSGIVLGNMSSADHHHSHKLITKHDQIYLLSRVKNSGGSYDYDIYVHNNSGNRVTTFGTNGYKKVSGSSSTSYQGFDVDENGKILVADRSNPSNYQTKLFRLNTDGSFDYSFGNNGVFEMSFFTGHDGAANLAVLPDGRIVVAGEGYDVNVDIYRPIVLVLNDNGTLDTTFNHSGYLKYEIAPSNNYESALLSAVFCPNDGSVILFGYLWDYAAIVVDYLGYIGVGAKLKIKEQTTPVELVSFSAKISDGKILLNWSTVTESNHSGWEVERKIQAVSTSGQHWEKIGFVAGKGTTTESQAYSFDVNGSELKTLNHQFRLKQIDNDGKFSYSNVLTVSIIPDNFGLDQNYPNPFNPNTVISYQVAAVSHVRLVVFDLLGREVAVLVNEKKEAGKYSVNFSALNLPSGFYFYKLTAGNFSDIKKMTLIK